MRDGMYLWEEAGRALIKEGTSYKYLGVELDNKLSFSEFKKRIGEKARKNVSRVWSMGMFSVLIYTKR